LKGVADLKRPFAFLFATLIVGTIVLEIGEIVQQRRPAYLIGLDTASGAGSREVFLTESFEQYCAANHWKYQVSNADGNPAAQARQVRQMVQSGVNGLIVSAPGAESAGPVVAAAAAAHVPVFTTGMDIDSPNITMYVGFSGKRAGMELAQEIVDRLRAGHRGQVRGTVLEMTGPRGSLSAVQRSTGFHAVIDRYKGVRVISTAGDFQEAPARIATERVLRGRSRIDACFSASGSMAVGVVDAFKDLGMNPARVCIVTIDATPRVLRLIRAGDIQMALGQTPGFYSAIAAHYLVEYLKHGSGGLPRVGETITAKSLALSAGDESFDIWGNRAPWAPARIVRGLAGHVWFQTGTVLVTRDNVNAPYLWANIKLPAKA
jgi:ribose transport system substrate-binding protein